MYYVSNGSLRPANRQYNTTNNDYEMSLNERSIIVRVPAQFSFPSPLLSSAHLSPALAPELQRSLFSACASQEEAEDMTAMAVEVHFDFLVRSQLCTHEGAVG